jgi:aconitate hydratase
MGMIAIGAGGLDVAVAMGGGAFYLNAPRVIGVELRGELGPWVSAKDVVLTLISALTTRGNVGCALEYFGQGVGSLPVPARATCTNMGAEMGVSFSIFPADAVTEQFLSAQGRGEQFTPIAADAGCDYDTLTKRLHTERDAEAIASLERLAADLSMSGPDGEGFVEVSFSRLCVDLAAVEPLAAGTPSPDNIHRVADLAGKNVSQVLIGSCTNSSYQDLMRTAELLKGRTVSDGVELGIAPGSRQVLNMLAENGALADLVRAGARILESSCGPCIGQGFSPAEGAVSVRTFNRNFAGRSGTVGDEVYLVSPETAAAAAIAGELIDPRELGKRLKVGCPAVEPPATFEIDDGMIALPADADRSADVVVIRGTTIVKPPAGEALPDPIDGTALIKVGDKITTDHIMPAGAFLKHRSNVPEYAKAVFHSLNAPGEPTFAERAQHVQAAGRAGVIVAGDSYGQGSSREHAALCPMYLGVRVVIAKSIERIHQANLVNFGILPLTFAAAGDYDAIDAGDELRIDSVAAAVTDADSVTVRNETKDCSVDCRVTLTPRQRRILAAGGLLNATRG